MGAPVEDTRKATERRHGDRVAETLPGHVPTDGSAPNSSAQAALPVRLTRSSREPRTQAGTRKKHPAAMK